MINSIYLRRKKKILIKEGNNKLPDVYLASILKNIESIGYTFSKKLMDTIRTLSIDELEVFYDSIIVELKKIVGHNLEYKPMYPNFPKQVMDSDVCTLYINAIIHYITLDLPKCKVQERIPLLDNINLRVIDLGEEEEFKQICIDLLSSKTSISEADKEDIKWFVEEYKDDVNSIIPKDIPLKENVALLASLLLKHTNRANYILFNHIKTATDVLRLTVALSDGDTSLATNTRFRNFKRSERRLILSLLENCNNITEDMVRYKDQWIRLGEKLHPFEYKGKYPKSFQGFNIIRNNIKIETFNSKIEKAFLNNDIIKSVDLLKTRPGEFARRLDQLLRSTEDWQYVIDKFKKVCGEIASPVLMQVIAHFKYRNKDNDLRVFFPKGNVAKVYAIKNNLTLIDDQVCNRVVKICENELRTRFSNLPQLGNVYIDEKLNDYIVPFSQRSSSKALRTIVRGSQIDISDGNTIRFFLWWKEGFVGNVHTGRVDIDLSAIIYDKNWGYLEHASYTNLKSDKYKVCHSGDIVEAPNGACEFIDIDINSIIKYGGRYIVMSLNSFTEQPYCNLPECYAGWMMRQYPNSGEVFEPATVKDKIDVTADSRICIPVILDLVERKVIWSDLALKSNPYLYNNIEGNEKGMVLMGKAITNLSKFNLYQLFKMHANARGTIIDEIDKADTVFSVDRGITPFDIEKIMSEFM